VKGETNYIQDKEKNNHRIEIERLFYIGMNLGVTCNEDRMLMVEKLIDWEGNEGATEVVLGEVEMDS
jgi:hypothetical protein